MASTTGDIAIDTGSPLKALCAAGWTRRSHRPESGIQTCGRGRSAAGVSPVPVSNRAPARAAMIAATVAGSVAVTRTWTQVPPISGLLSIQRPAASATAGAISGAAATVTLMPPWQLPEAEATARSVMPAMTINRAIPPAAIEVRTARGLMPACVRCRPCTVLPKAHQVVASLRPAWGEARGRKGRVC